METGIGNIIQEIWMECDNRIVLNNSGLVFGNAFLQAGFPDRQTRSMWEGH